MFCTKCGQSVTPGAAFCSHCGQTLMPAAEPPQGYVTPPQSYAAPPQGYVTPPQGYVTPPQSYAAPPQGYVAPPQSYAAPPQGYVTPPQGYAAPPQGYVTPPQGYAAPAAVKKKKTGIIVGIIAGGVVLLAIVAVLLFAWPGLLKASQNIAGTWYSEKRGEVIHFGSGHSFDAQTSYGDFEGEYTFDVKSGEGHIEMEDSREFDFLVDQDRLFVYNMGAFDRADDDFDTDDFLKDAWIGIRRFVTLTRPQVPDIYRAGPAGFLFFITKRERNKNFGVIYIKLKMTEFSRYRDGEGRKSCFCLLTVVKSVTVDFTRVFTLEGEELALRAFKYIITIVIVLALGAGAVIFALKHEEKGPGSSDQGTVTSGVQINEIMASNSSYLPDNLGNYSDWIEIYNPGDSRGQPFGLSADRRPDGRQMAVPQRIFSGGWIYARLCVGKRCE